MAIGNSYDALEAAKRDTLNRIAQEEERDFRDWSAVNALRRQQFADATLQQQMRDNLRLNAAALRRQEEQDAWGKALATEDMKFRREQLKAQIEAAADQNRYVMDRQESIMKRQEWADQKRQMPGLLAMARQGDLSPKSIDGLNLLDPNDSKILKAAATAAALSFVDAERNQRNLATELSRSRLLPEHKRLATSAVTPTSWGLWSSDNDKATLDTLAKTYLGDRYPVGVKYGELKNQVVSAIADREKQAEELKAALRGQALKVYGLDEKGAPVQLVRPQQWMYDVAGISSTESAGSSKPVYVLGEDGDWILRQ